MRAIHFCIDMQKNYPAERPHYSPWWGSVKRNITRLDHLLRERGIDTVYVAYGSSGHIEPFKQGVGMVKDMPLRSREVLDRHPDMMVDFDLPPTALLAFKNDFSLCHEPAISDYVRCNEISTIILSGIFEASEILHDQRKGIPEPHAYYGYYGHCLSQTAWDFRLAGHEVVIAAEATQRGVEDSTYFSPLAKRRATHGTIGIKVNPVDEIMDSFDVVTRLHGRKASHATSESRFSTDLR
ncbi:MAG: hypothetical protein P4M15_01440 [Alphaproteobacteria bacterium]|nr:hypothetical protein [Alphaproteobacteria bacterium]